MASSTASSAMASQNTSATPSKASSELSEAPPSVTPAEATPDDSSKLKMFLGILRKFIGVADIASVRFSLPAQLLEPRPNLEYWTYLDVPYTFCAIGDSDDPLDRMLEVCRFWFTKDLKYVKGKPCKPYNSALGEFFRCNWEVTESAPSIASIRPSVGTTSSSSSIRSLKTTPAPSRTTSAANVATLSKLGRPIRVSYLTEQTSHHPPVSAFYVSCPEKGLTARGFDQISAKFTGTSIRVTPGEHNFGIFIDLEKRDNEQYQLTHPAAHLGGLLRGSLSVTVGDHCYITCPKTKLKVILHYLEEGWLGKTQNKVEGVIFRYDPGKDDKTKIKDVPEKDVLARLQGNWKDKLYFSLASNTKEQALLIDLEPLSVAAKSIPPPELQQPNESLRFWGGVTDAIQSKQFARATQAKQDLEDSQRQKAKKREVEEREWTPRFYKGIVTPKGMPELSDEGKALLESLQKGEWDIPSAVVERIHADE